MCFQGQSVDAIQAFVCARAVVIAWLRTELGGLKLSRYPQLDTHRPMDQPNRGEGPELGWKTGQKESRNSPSAALVDNPKKFFATIR